MMKWSYALVLSVAATALSLSSCGDNSEKKINERSVELGFMNQLPQDTAVAVGVYDVPTYWNKIKESALARIIYNEDDSDEGNFLKPIETSTKAKLIESALGSEIVIAQMGKGANFINKITDIGREINTLSLSAYMDDESGSEMTAKLSSEISKLCSIDLPPIIIALKNHEPGYLMIKEALDKKLKKVQEEEKLPLEEYSQSIGNETWSGYKMNVKTFFKTISTPEDIVTLDIPEDKNIYLLLHRLGEHTVIILASQPSEIQFAPSMKEGLVGSKEFDFMNHYVGKKPVSVAYISQALNSAFLTMSTTNLENQEKQYSEMITLVAKKNNLEATSLLDSLRIFFSAYGHYTKFMYGEPTEVGIFSWWDKGLICNIHNTNNLNAFDTKADLSFGNIAQDPNSIFYAESVMTEPAKVQILNLMDKMGDLALKSSDFFFSSNDPSLTMYKPIYEQNKPALIQIGQGIYNILENGINNHTAYAVNKTAEPQYIDIVAVSNVLNPIKIKEGWKSICDGGDAIGMSTMQGMWAMFVPQATTTQIDIAGQTFDYSEAKPAPGLLAGLSNDPSTTPEISAAAVLNDKLLVYGISGNSVKTIATQALQSVDKANKGIAFTINLKNVYSLITTISPEFEKYTTPLSQDINKIEYKLIEMDSMPVQQLYFKAE